MTKLLLLASLSLVACNDDRAPDPRFAPYAAPSTAAATESPGCGKLVAPSIAAHYLTGFALTEHKLSNHATRCSYAKHGTSYVRSIVDLSFHCSDQMIAAMPATKAMLKNVEEIGGIGRGAIRIMGVIEFWDDDTNCMVTVAAYGSDAPHDLVALAHDLATTITPASVQ